MSDEDLLKIKTLAMANRKLDAKREAEKYVSLAVEQKAAHNNVTFKDSTNIRNIFRFSLASLRLS